MSFTKLKEAARTADPNANLSIQSRHNPNAPGIKKSLWVWMNRWYEAEGKERFAQTDGSEASSTLAIVDLEAANGEVSNALHQWYTIGSTPSPSALSSTSAASPSATAAPAPPVLQTALHPLLQTNMKSALASRPPFIPPSRRSKPAAGSSVSETSTPVAAKPTSSITDTPASNSNYQDSSSLTGGQYSSLVRPPTLPKEFKTLEILPTTTTTPSEAFPTHLPTPVHIKFRQVAHGKLPLPQSYSPTAEVAYPKFDMIFCSFALHLAGEPSELYSLLTELSLRGEWLVVLAGGKKPFIGEGRGWVRWDFGQWIAAEKQEGNGKDLEDDDDEEEEDEEESEQAIKAKEAEEVAAKKAGGEPVAIELRRDRVRLRVYRSLNAIA